MNTLPTHAKPVRRTRATIKAVCVLLIFGCLPNASAANVKLVPTSPVVNVIDGDIITVDVVIDFSDVGGTLGGSFNLTYDGVSLDIVGLFFDPLAGEPDFHRTPNIIAPFGPGEFRDWAVGAFDGIPGPLLLGTIEFEVRPTMGLDTVINSQPTTGVGGPWISGQDFVTIIAPSYNNLVITRSNGVGSVCGDSLLYTGETCDDGNANAGDGCSATCTIERDFECTLPIPGNPPIPSVCTAVIDTDNDGWTDQNDNCVLVANVSQIDIDGDGIGNVCDPDFDNNCVVNFIDYSMLVARFLSTMSPLYDLNSDGVVNFSDFAIYAPFFLLPPGPGADNSLCD